MVKVRQVIYIEGQPDCLFKKVNINYHKVVSKEKTFEVGKIRKEIIDILKKTDGIVVEDFIKTIIRPKRPDLYRSGITSMKRDGGNTLITITADNDGDLNFKFNTICMFLHKHGIDVTKRCHFVCDLDTKEKVDINKIKLETVKSEKKKKKKHILVCYDCDNFKNKQSECSFCVDKSRFEHKNDNVKKLI